LLKKTMISSKGKLKKLEMQNLLRNKGSRRSRLSKKHLRMRLLSTIRQRRVMVRLLNSMRLLRRTKN
jgi:hypothetical protein